MEAETAHSLDKFVPDASVAGSNLTHPDCVDDWISHTAQQNHVEQIVVDAPLQANQALRHRQIDIDCSTS